MICQFCLTETKLIEAHIIPKWAFKSLYPDPKDRSEPLILVEKGSVKKRPIGPYDPNILCSKCDNFFSIYEGYAKKVFFEMPRKNYSTLSQIVENANIDKVKIFLLSVIWRASISSRPEFQDVTLGAYKEKIRNLLLTVQSSQDETLAKEYLFIATKFDNGTLPQGVVEGNVMMPRFGKIGPINVIYLYLPGGLKFIVKTDQRRFSKEIEKIANFDSGGLLIVNIGNYSDSQEFDALIKIAKGHT